MIIFILIGVLFLFMGCITLLMYYHDNSKLLNKERLTDDIRILFNDEIEAYEDRLIDQEIL